MSNLQERNEQHPEFLRLEGVDSTSALDTLRAFNDIVCAEVPPSDLPVGVRRLVNEVACLCIVLPGTGEDYPNFHEIEDFDFYNCLDHELQECFSFLLVGGEVELDVWRFIDFTDAIENQLPVLFVHNDSWSLVSYPWDHYTMADQLHAASMSSGPNSRYFRYVTDKEIAEWNATKGNEKKKLRPNQYVYSAGVRETYKEVSERLHELRERESAEVRVAGFARR